MSAALRSTGSETLPLAGIRVIEFCHTIMGPSCGLVLADLGADVVKVEPAPDGDKTRRLAGFAAGFFSYFNRNKRSLSVDMKSPEGLKIVERLVRSADVLVENFAPGTMDRLGCGYEALRAVNPRLVYCSLKGFLSGPYEHRPALDEVVQYMTGLAYMTGPPGQPLRAGASIVDVLGGVFGVVGILAALRERDRTGEGQLVKSALFESSAFLMAQNMAGEVVTGRTVPPMPARVSAWAIYEPFATADGESVFVGITSDNHWRRFCTRFARPDLLADPELRTNEQRVAARARLRPIVAEIVARHPLAEIVGICERESIPFSPVARPGDLFEDPQLNAHGRMLVTEMPGGKTAKLPRLPVEIGAHDLALRRQPPRLGEHSEEVLRELGVDRDEIAALREKGIVAGEWITPQ
jgi:crotonobetainyl-CoA:carnitine CoA-transferase CaiB-like acyl-CoA transferase